MTDTRLAVQHRRAATKSPRPHPAKADTESAASTGQSVALHTIGRLPGARARPTDLLSLQRTVGNQRVARGLAQRVGLASTERLPDHDATIARASASHVVQRGGLDDLFGAVGDLVVDAGKAVGGLASGIAKAVSPANDPAVLGQARGPRDLFDLYAIRQWIHVLPGTAKTFGQDWIDGSHGAGLIRQEIRRQLGVIFTLARALPEPHGWFQAVSWYLSFLLHIKLIDGPEARKRDLLLVLDDVFDAHEWRATDPIPIDPTWSATRKRYARLWNEKGQLFAELARDLDPDLEPYVVAGIMAAESRQQFFKEGTGLPIARFELHVFRKRWGKTSKDRQRLFEQHFKVGEGWKGHKWRPTAKGSFRSYHGDQDKEWEALDFARGLDGEADVKAVESTSFGAGQTMGFNYERVGFTSPLEMLQHYQTRERAQVEGIVNYIATIKPASKKTKVIDAIKAGNFLPLSKAYGPANPAGHAKTIVSAVKTMKDLVEAAEKARAKGTAK
ncbi:MAG: N-acetylmuramidase domain-containing protein [Thermomicrobiales bacterium]